jgi:hypothetical protein
MSPSDRKQVHGLWELVENRSGVFQAAVGRCGGRLARFRDPSFGGCRVNVFGCVTIWLGLPVIAGKVFGGYPWPSRFGT